MKIKIIATIALLVLYTGTLCAQNEHFTVHGTIEFEKNINMYAMIQKQITPDNEAFFAPILESYKKTQPQFKKVKSTLSFTDNKTLYRPIVPTESNDMIFSEMAMSGQPNIIYTDLDTKTSATQKTVYEELFMVKDTARKINWKITDETREIAGYTCRRANALVLDSIYVVAFYAIQIPVSGGPESFSGLPGMILGVALPHENVTWFATKVTDVTVEPKAMVMPKKGKVVTTKELTETLKQLMKNWGPWANAQKKALLL